MGQRKIRSKKRRVYLEVPNWTAEMLAQDSVASYRFVSDDPEDLGPACYLLFKYAWLENARVLARHNAGRYEFLCAFLDDQARDRARDNITAAFESEEGEPPPIEPVAAPDLNGWEPFGRVVPKDVSDIVVLFASSDEDMIESTHLGILARQERDPNGDYVFPNMDEEHAAAWRKFRDRKTQ